MINFFDLLGLIGVSLIVYGYARVQWKREYVKSMSYSALNFLGSMLMCTSLLDKWNPSAFVVNVIMASISLYGIRRCYKYARRRKNKQENAPYARQVFSRKAQRRFLKVAQERLLQAFR